jgi:hypothetical protein
MTSASARQVKKILWREVRAFWRRAAARGYDLGPEPALDPETGVQWDDGREIFGFTSRDPEKAAGVSGAHLLFLLDEASGISEEIFEAIEGNRAGGARIVLASHPRQVLRQPRTPVSRGVDQLAPVGRVLRVASREAPILPRADHLQRRGRRRRAPHPGPCDEGLDR